MRLATNSSVSQCYLHIFTHHSHRKREICMELVYGRVVHRVRHRKSGRKKMEVECFLCCCCFVVRSVGEKYLCSSSILASISRRVHVWMQYWQVAYRRFVSVCVCRCSVVVFCWRYLFATFWFVYNHSSFFSHRHFQKIVWMQRRQPQQHQRWLLYQ